MAIIGLQQAETDWQHEQDLRKQALDQLSKMRGFAEQGVTDIETAQAKAQKSLAARSAQAMAATLGQVGGAPAGGGQVAALRQSANQRGVAEGAQDLTFAKQLSEARNQAASTAFESISAEKALGTLTGERQKKMSQAEQQLQGLMNQYLNGTLGIGNDVGAFRKSANALLSAEGDPAVREYITNRIGQIAGSQNFNLLSALLYPLTGQGDAGLG